MNTIRIDPGRVLASREGRPFGININYLRDLDLNRPVARPLREAVREMGAGHLRYPGGEKSDWVLFERGRPRPLKRYAAYAEGHHLMDLDAFISLCREADAEPHVVVAYDREDNTGVSEEAYLNNALDLLRYANMEKAYGIIYWEIGNENWHNNTASPEEMARIVCRFSAGMKALDPSIKICASGAGMPWWRAFLPLAGPCIDCLTVSQYSCMDWGGYRYFAERHDLDLVGNLKDAAAALKAYLPGRADQVKVILSELNSKDYADLFGRPHWADSNDLGHAVVTFCILMQMLEMPETAYGMLWNTRWMHQEEEAKQIWYGLNRDNQLLPSAQPLMLLARFLKEDMLPCEAPEGMMAFASADREKRVIDLFIVNKRLVAAERPAVSILGGRYGQRQAWVYAGEGPQDLAPRLSSLPEGAPLPPASVTILQFEKA